MFKCRVFEYLKDITSRLARLEEGVSKLPSRDDLDAAVAAIGDKIAAAADRVQAAIAALQAKVDAGQDFSAELATLTQEGAALDNIAPTPAP